MSIWTKISGSTDLTGYLDSIHPPSRDRTGNWIEWMAIYQSSHANVPKDGFARLTEAPEAYAESCRSSVPLIDVDLVETTDTVRSQFKP